MTTVDTHADLMAALATLRDALREVEDLGEDPDAFHESRVYSRLVPAQDAFAAAYDAHTAGPRTWSLDREPGPDVTAVRDANGTKWQMIYAPPASRWAPEGAKPTDRGDSWRSVLYHFGPLTDASGESS